MATLAAILTILATVLPVIFQNLRDKKVDGEAVRKELVKRDLAQLHADLERLRARKHRPVVPQR